MAFATTTDLANRLGVTLTVAQTTQASAALDAATAVVAAELDKTPDEISAVPELLKHVTITVALRAYANPQGLANESERLGDYQRSAGYLGGDTLSLTGVERLLVRRAYFGSSSGSSRPLSTVDEVYDYLYS